MEGGGTWCILIEVGSRAVYNNGGEYKLRPEIGS